MMRKAAKIWLIAAASLILIGCIMFCGVMAVYKWNFAKLSTARFETNDYEINEGYQNISIVTNTADLVFVPSGSSDTSVVCYEQKNVKHSVAVKDGTLVIEVVDTRNWYEHIGISIDTSKITVYVPRGDYGVLSVRSSTGDVKIPKDFKFERIDISENTGNVTSFASASELIKIKTSTGNIHIGNVFAGALDLSVSTGSVTASAVTCEGDFEINVSTGKAVLTDITCKSVVSDGSTGGITLKNVIAAETFSIERSTGDVKFDGCDAAEIFVKTDTGDVAGTLLSGKEFIVETDTGRADVPKTGTGGRCEITTDTGDIRIKIQQ